MQVNNRMHPPSGRCQILPFCSWAGYITVMVLHKGHTKSCPSERQLQHFSRETGRETIRCGVQALHTDEVICPGTPHRHDSIAAALTYSAQPWQAGQEPQHNWLATSTHAGVLPGRPAILGS